MNKLCAWPLPLLAGLLLLLTVGCGTQETDIPPDTAVPVAITAVPLSNTEPPTATATPVAATRAEVVQSLTAKVILPGYIAAADAIASLSESVAALCSGPSEAELEAAQDDWREARQAWLRTESYRFGPAMERRSISLVDWWPIDVEKIDRNLASDERVTPERVTEFLPSTQRGFSTAEYLLFGADSADPSDWSNTKRCAYLQSVAAVTRDELDGILADWQGTGDSSRYATYFDGTGSLALIDSDAEAELVRSLVFQVRSIANMRLGAALGVDQEIDTSAVPGGSADNSREDLLSQLDGIAAIYRGADGGLGLSARVAAISADTEARMLSAIQSTISATRELDGSILAQLESNPAHVRAVYDNMKELQRVLNTEIVSLLGVSVGFSDTDGDS